MKYVTTFVLGGSFLVLPAIVGCDDASTNQPVVTERKVDVKSDGTVKKEQTTVQERPDGSLVKEETETKREVK